jgi:hypothetical protein
MQKHSKTHKNSTAPHRYHPVFTPVHLGMAAIASMSLFGLAETSKYHLIFAELATGKQFTNIENSTEEKKTMRMPIRYNDGLREITISGA